MKVPEGVKFYNGGHVLKPGRKIPAHLMGFEKTIQKAGDKFKSSGKLKPVKKADTFDFDKEEKKN